MAKLMLTADRIREELFTGGFRPMAKTDFYVYADADEGSLIADIKVGRFEYQVIFSPAMGNVQLFALEADGFETAAWEMDLLSGEFIEL